MKILINLIVSAVVVFLYLYVALHPINLQSSDFYTFIGILCVVYVVSALITSGMNVVSSGGGPKEYLRFIKTQCLPVGILFLALIAVAIVGSVLSMPLFRSAVLDGNTYYFIRLEGEEVFYSVSASQNEVAVILNVGDSVTIEHEVPQEGSESLILDGYTITSHTRGSSAVPAEPSASPEPQTGAAA